MGLKAYTKQINLLKVWEDKRAIRTFNVTDGDAYV